MANNKIEKIFPKVDWNGVSSTMESSGKLRLADFANEYGVSVPTMRKILERKFGSKIMFRRGRTGGVFPAADFPYAPKAVPTGLVSYSEDSASAVTAVVDDETEAIVDSILGIEA